MPIVKVTSVPVGVVEGGVMDRLALVGSSGFTVRLWRDMQLLLKSGQ